MKQTLSDFNLFFEHVLIKCDNTSAINISKNPVQHSRIKHIVIKYHFLRDYAQKGDITLEFVSTKDQLADIFTKPLSEEQFVDIRRQLWVISLWSNDFLMNSSWIYLMIAWISYHMHHIEIILGKKVKFWLKIKIPLALDIKIWGFQLKRVGGGSWDKKKQKIGLLTVDQAVDRFVGAEDLKRLPCFIFSTVLLHSLKTLHIPASWNQFGQDLGPFAGLGVDFGSDFALTTHLS